MEELLADYIARGGVVHHYPMGVRKLKPIWLMNSERMRHMREAARIKKESDQVGNSTPVRREHRSSRKKK